MRIDGSYEDTERCRKRCLDKSPPQINPTSARDTISDFVR